jgi:hypothetical protein
MQRAIIFTSSSPAQLEAQWLQRAAQRKQASMQFLYVWYPVIVFIFNNCSNNYST